MIIFQGVCSFLVKCPYQRNLHYQRFALWDRNTYKVYFTWIGGFNDSSDRKYGTYWNWSGIPSWSKVTFCFFYLGDRVHQHFFEVGFPSSTSGLGCFKSMSRWNWPQQKIWRKKHMECHTLTKLVKLFISNANSFLVWPKTSQSTQKIPKEISFPTI